MHKNSKKNHSIPGFSKLPKKEKIAWLAENFLNNSGAAVETLEKYWHPDKKLQQLHEEFTENTLSNFYLPFGIAPNFLINGKNFAIPMVIEESSVIAAASKAAKFWGERGGFKAKVLNTKKNGQVHFIFKGKPEKLTLFFETIKPKLLASVAGLTENMEKRGGGLLEIELKNKTDKLPHYHQLHCTFETKDAMGANFINTCLEKFGKTLEREAQNFELFLEEEKNIEVVMAILSNYVPECLVRAEVSCSISPLNPPKGEILKGNKMGLDKKKISKIFGEKFIQAIEIAEQEPSRATTHNKGIMNGIDAVVIATGNDFRAVEAGAHSFAAKDGSYTSLTHAKIENGVFRYWIEIPLALGTVGGLTNLHPLVKTALEILQKPSAKELMEIIAAVGLAQNFAAVNSLITTGIQKGHMKMHLTNILNQHQATKTEKNQLAEYFETRTVTHNAVKNALQNLRDGN